MQAHWGYASHDGPEHWGDLDPRYNLCKTGRSQSPIDIVAPVDNPVLGPLGVAYKKTGVVLVNNGHTIQVNCDPGSRLVYESRRYELLQFHFHHPSEHLIDSQAAAVEAHLVHRSQDGLLAVIGVLMQLGDDDSVLARFWKRLPLAEGAVETGVAMNPAELLPLDGHFYAYEGSLTTPPCSEGVQWIVMQQMPEVSQAQVEQFLRAVGPNARPVQPLNDRTVFAW